VETDPEAKAAAVTATTTSRNATTNARIEGRNARSIGSSVRSAGRSAGNNDRTAAMTASKRAAEAPVETRTAGEDPDSAPRLDGPLWRRDQSATGIPGAGLLH
jgi:hypothetical protein